MAELTNKHLEFFQRENGFIYRVRWDGKKFICDAPAGFERDDHAKVLNVLIERLL
jgi:hypothetical protein